MSDGEARKFIRMWRGLRINWTYSMKRLSQTALERGRALYPEPVVRPESRAECPALDSHGKRRCPYVGCGYHLATEVNEANGSILIRAPHVIDEDGLPDIDFDAMPDTCALDMIDRHIEGMTLERIGELMHITRERARQIVDQGCMKLMQTDRSWKLHLQLYSEDHGPHETIL